MPRTHNATGRARKSSGNINVAPGGKRLRRNVTAQQWTWQGIDMLMSPAFRVLSLAARRLLDRLAIELARHGGTDNGALPATFDDFEAYGIHRHSIAPAIRECEALGFIEITQRGRAGNAEWRRPHHFRLTHKPTNDGPPTDEWRHITTSERAEVIASEARKAFPRKQNSS
jgi:hypothetical protein